MRTGRKPAFGLAVVATLGLALTACGFEADAGVESGNAAPATATTGEPATTTSEPATTAPDTTEATTVPDTEVPTTDTEPATTEPASTAPKDDVPVIELDTDKPAQDYDSFVQDALNEIQRFWRLNFEDLYGKPYEDLKGGVFPVYPGRRDVPGGCGTDRTTYRDVEGNAFYCGEGDFIAYDDTQLFPSLEDEIGRFALAVALAHEWGHAIQQRSGFMADSTLPLEQQADCFAGAFVGFLAAGNGQYIGFADEDLVQAINGLVAVRDEPGSAQSNPNAHGNAFDRVGAFQDGFVDGLDRCKSYDTNPPRSTLLPFTSAQEQQSGGNADYATLVSDLLKPALDTVWSAILDDRGVSFTPPTVDIGADDTATRCDDVPDNALKVAFYCPSTNTIVASDKRLQELYDTYGDNAVGLLIADAYSEAVQAALGSALEGEARALVNDCLSGAWTARLFPPDGVDIGGEAPVVISAGDLDEAIQTLVAIGDPRTDTDERGSSFEKIDAFRTGVLDGLDACLAMIGD